MTRKTIATISISILLLTLMIWSFGSSAAGNHQQTASNASPTSEATEIFQDNNQEEVDADLGKHGSKIDREEYLRLRGEYTARKRGIEPGRPFNPELRRDAIQQMERQEQNSRVESIVSGDLTPAAGGAWTPIGPLSITNGQSLSGGDTAVSGRVTAVVVDPTNPSNVYLGTAQGGVWKSINGGTTWQSIFDSAQTQAIGALAISPADTSKLYVGTGEFNGCGDCFFGAGLYRIDGVNGGSPAFVGPINPLQTVGSITYSGGIFNGRSITKIVVDPTNADNIFVAVARGIGGSGASALSNSFPPLGIRGLWRSSNATSAAGSVTFQKLISDTDNFDTTDIVIEPGLPNNLLVAQLGNGILRTTNALSGTPTFTQVYSSTARINLAINKVGSVVTAYAATGETPTATSGCNDPGSGALRKQVDPFNNSTNWTTQLTGGGGFCAGQCFYDIAIAVNPTNANEVYLGGSARQTNPPSPCPDGMKKSTDGGATFTRDDTGLHADSHALFYDNAGNVYAGNDGGIWKGVPSGGATTWTSLNTSPLNTLQFESIAVHATNQFMMIGGTQDNGTEYQQTSSGNWSNAEGGDGGYCLIDQSTSDTRFVAMYHTFFNQVNNQIGFDRSVDSNCLPIKNFWPTRGIGFVGNGDNEQTSLSCDGTANYLHNGLSLTDNVLFYAPMALGPGTPNTVYFGTDRLYRSIDRGDHMTVVSQASISSPGITGSPISNIAIWPQGDNIRMVGLQNGQVWATSTGSSTLVNLASPAPANPSGSTTNKFIGRAMIDPNNKNVAYIALSYYAPAGQGIWKITNLTSAAVSGGTTPNWVAAANGIPSIPINAFAIDPLNSNNLYAGTDIGVYFSSDAGANWSPFGTGLPRVAVFDLQIQPTSRLLRAGTHGRGVWETPLVSPAASTVQFTASSTSVTEGTGGASVDAIVTVQRGGDISFPASVNYATSDGSGANGCGVIGSSASSRCDYIATLGTLNFAANESSKQISIPVLPDSYAENAESFTMTLTAAGGLNVSLGTPASITVTINNSGFTGPNQIDSTGPFVRQQYVDFLNREPDTSGFNFWSNNIDSCGSNVGLCEVRRIDTSAAFFLSIEFQQTGYLVEKMYKASFGSNNSAVSTLGGTHTLSVPIIRFNEFLADTQRIGRGVIVNQGNWQQQLEDNKQAFMEEFVQRSRFLTDYPASMSQSVFVDQLNSRAGNPLSTAERDQLVSDLSAGIKTRGQALRTVAEDPDLDAAEKNRAFVLMEFFGYLRRNPNDQQDSDYTGYDFWLTKLNQFNGNYINAEMVKAFLSSIEYRQRFAQ
ncbi:MAG: hypothetical protein DMF72_19305 [Acidobacteria bacterium]|nr:MAG: hypothetical protein DMF72_19305 [Acidobacteriota bacterium]